MSSLPSSPAVTSSFDEVAATPWYAREADDVVADLDVDPTRGLSADEADRRREQVGPNRLEDAKRRHPALKLLDQFLEPLIVLLLVAGIVAFLIGDTVDAIAILVVVTINGVLGWVQEMNAERQVDALRSMVTARSACVAPASSTPSPPPTSSPVTWCCSRRAIASRRTGGSSSPNAPRSRRPRSPASPSPSRRRPARPRRTSRSATGQSAAFSGTHVSRGRLEMVVVATGAATELGRLAALVDASGGSVSPLREQLDDLGKRLAFVAAGGVVILAALGLVRGTPIGEVAIEAVAVAAAALPEGLPTAVTITLALAVSAMAKRNAVVRGLPAVETLGATSVICTDKTGTLTEQRLQVVEAYVDGAETALDDEAVRPALRAFVLASDAAAGTDGDVGDPTEVALLGAAREAGLDVDDLRGDVRRIAEDPFDPTTRRMTVVVEHRDGRVSCWSRAPRKRSSTPASNADIGPVDALAERALRTLAVARRDIAADESLDDVEALLHDLEPLGLVALMDPLRPTAADTIAAARRAGMDVVMMTGDHKATAASIAKDAGIDGKAVEGRDIRRMSDDELDAVVQDLGVVARVAPDDKLRIVQSFQRHGRVVAVTGDGANDAAALRAAEVGVALGSGTDVAREAADVVLLDDDLGTLMEAVERGRAMHDNLGTFLRFQLTTSASLVLSLVVASIAAMAAPMSAAQVLWVNLVADGPPAVALGIDPPRRGVLDRAPRDPNASLLDRTLVRAIIPAALIMAAAALATQLYVSQQLTGEWNPAETPVAATTVAFTAFVFAQVLNAFVVRVGPGNSVLRVPPRNPFLYGSLVVVVVLQVVLVQVPALNTIARTTPLTAQQWGIAVVAALVWPVVRELTIGARKLAGR